MSSVVLRSQTPRAGFDIFVQSAARPICKEPVDGVAYRQLHRLLTGDEHLGGAYEQLGDRGESCNSIGEQRYCFR
jgi:hypothetical protein